MKKVVILTKPEGELEYTGLIVDDDSSQTMVIPSYIT